MADLTFYSSVRQGAALGITRADTGSGPAEDHARLQVTLDYGPGHAATATLPLVGPGDIVGLDTRSIVRSFPRVDDNDGEAGFLCYIDFDQVDLPWRYTPAHYTKQQLENKQDRVRPWLSLLVFVEGTEVTDDDLRPPRRTEKLPQLTVRDGNLLPDLTHAWAWAHVQGGGLPQTDAAIADALKGRPGAVTARLLSPRSLAPSTAYRAFLVPTFLRGVMAGQGKDPDDPQVTDGLTSAWGFPALSPTVLPVYHSWRFQTGTVSSFREAARQLRPAAALPPTVGARAIEVSVPGFGLLSPTGGTAQMSMGGALQRPDQVDDLDPTPDSRWVNGLGLFIESGILPGSSGLRVVAPPLYGRWYAAEDHLDRRAPLPPPPPPSPAPTNPPWFFSLNSDPRYRVAAGLGTEVVQRDQQALMAAAMEQTSRVIESVNRTRKIMQAGREVFTRLITRHLPATTPGANFLVTSFLHGKILNCAGPPPRPTIGGFLIGSTFRGRVHPWRRTFRGDPTILIDTINTGGFDPKPATPPNTSTPEGTVGGEVPGGLPDPGVGTIISTMNADQRLYWGVVIFWVARRLLSTDGGKYWWLLRRLLRLGLDLIQLASAQGVANLAVLQKLRAGTLQGSDIASLPVASNFVSVSRDPVLGNPTSWPATRTPTTGGVDPPEAVAFKQAAVTLFNYVNGAPLLGPLLARADVPSLATCILNAVSPAITFVAAERSRHFQQRMIPWQAPDQLEPILVTPKISYPVWSLLRDVSVDWILPGAGDLPRNSVSLVATNQKFIEAFMVGLNHEMNREFLWNGYPTDQRGTYFQQFWDFRGWLNGGDQGPRTEDQFVDIKPITEWDRTSGIGSHTGRLPATAHLVLLVRGDIIKRYPNVVVYASQAKTTPQPGVLAPNDSVQRHPVFQAILTGDTAFYGFELSEGEARGTSGTGLGYFFVLQEHPSEPKFRKNENVPVNGTPGDYSANVAADVPATAYEIPTRVAIHGKDLLLPST